jgi:hypothetical protein
MKCVDKTRYLANFFLLIGQSFILFSSIEIGIIIKVIGACLLLSSFIPYKMWDMVLVAGAFTLLDLSKLISLLLN